MQTVERNGSFFRFRVAPFEPADAGGEHSKLLVEQELIFGSSADAAMFLRLFAGDEFAVRGLQSVLASLGETSSVNEPGDEWIDRLAVDLANGRVLVVEHTRRDPAGDASDIGVGASSLRARAPVTPRATPDKPPPAIDPATFPPTADELAQVQALKNAAQDGVPFCEECAKAAAQRSLTSV